MPKTPVVEKTRNSVKTPKTVPKKLNGTSSNILRAKLDYDTKASINVASICTPSRTTRSMAKVTSNDMPPPSLPFVTPSKRKTIASTASLKKSFDDTNGSSDGAFVRMRKYKRMELANNVEESIEISDSADDTDGKKGRVRGRKTKTKMNKDEIEDGQNEKMEKRSRRKSKHAKNISIESSDEDLHSDNIHEIKSTDESNDEELASVSQLGMNTSGQIIQSRKSKLSIASNGSSSPVSNKRRSSSTRKSIQGTDVAMESNANILASDTLPEEDRKPGQFARSRKSKQGNEQIESSNSDAVESNDEGLASVSQLGMNTSSQIVGSRKSKLSIASDSSSSPVPNKRRSSSVRKSNQGIEVIIEKKTRKSTQLVDESKQSDSEIENAMQIDQTELNEDNVSSSPPNEMSVDEGDEGDKENDINENVPSITPSDSMVKASGNETNDFPAAENKAKKRISVIDLTDSPSVPNTSVLNVTFTEEGKNDKTFSPINNKTFSPVPSAKKPTKNETKPTTPTPLKKRVSLSLKSTGKKKSPPLKRLQTTPFSKSKIRNNLNTSTKLSSAKKVKVAEAAVELIDSSNVKAIEKVKASRVTIESPKPKVFKFGVENHQNPIFRFSLVSENLLKGAQNGKSNVKPAPNFNNIHNQLFKKAESIDEAKNRHVERAKILLSGKKPPQDQKNVPKSVTKNPPPKFKLNVNEGNKEESRKPLARMNREQMNDEARQERRKQLFKQGPKRSLAKNIVPTIKGVRMNRRFELLMKNRNAAKKN